jgi:hypothetical protein
MSCLLESIRHPIAPNEWCMNSQISSEIWYNKSMSRPSTSNDQFFLQGHECYTAAGLRKATFSHFKEPTTFMARYWSGTSSRIREEPHWVEICLRLLNVLLRINGRYPSDDPILSLDKSPTLDDHRPLMMSLHCHDWQTWGWSYLPLSCLITPLLSVNFGLVELRLSRRFHPSRQTLSHTLCVERASFRSLLPAVRFQSFEWPLRMLSISCTPDGSLVGTLPAVFPVAGSD